jgi:hypothetical protein
MGRRKAVNGTTEIIILARVSTVLRCPTFPHLAFRTRLRLIVAAGKLRSLLHFFPSATLVKPCRYERLIAGRTYVIDVTLVSTGRWRAGLARLPGMPTSLMPFYGTTPEDAAHAITNWLSMVLTPSPLPSPPPKLDHPTRSGLP